MPAPQPAPDPSTSVEPTVAGTSTSETDGDIFVPPNSSSTTLPTSSLEIDTGDVVGFDVIEATLGGEPLTLALADDSPLRSRGLMGVSDLGELDGMLFSWGGDAVNSRFTMRNTLIPLRIAFFDADGAFVSQADMVPCDVEECPTYGAAGPYAYAIEFLAGTVVSPSARLELDLSG